MILTWMSIGSFYALNVSYPSRRQKLRVTLRECLQPKRQSDTITSTMSFYRMLMNLSQPVRLTFRFACRVQDRRGDRE